MAIEPGDVVILKSGGQPMTVAAVDESGVECLWLGEEGELFRETIPSVALSVVADTIDQDDEEDLDVEDDEEDEEAEREDADADEERSSKKKRRSA